MVTTNYSPSSALESAYTKALLRSLQFSGVQFLRYVTIDPYNNIRAKVKPIKHLLKDNSSTISLDQQVSIAEVCSGGLPYYADLIIDGTSLDARNVLSIKADPESLRILPYAPRTAIVMGSLKDQFTDEDSPFCTRSLLSSLVQRAAEQYNIAFNVGAELEFCLVDAKSIDGDGPIKFADQSVFANTTTLNEQEDFISALYGQFQQQYLPIELIHAESGPGQLEVVLEYSHNPVELCDNIVLAKETIAAVARQFGYKALFLPKYSMTKAGNGLHVHTSIRDAKTGQQLFCNGNTLTAQGSSFVEGILQHLPAIMGLSLPTVNSHRRVGKGCWTGSEVAWAVEDKEAPIRVCSNLRTKEWDHVEYKLFDSSANPYLALGALLHSGLSGIANKATLRKSLQDSDEGAVKVPLPGSLYAALRELEDDSVVTSFIGERLTKAYLAVRRHEMERALKMNLDEEVLDALSRC